jgi:hypothetical protein
MQLIPATSTPLEVKGYSQATLNTHVATTPTLILHFILTSISSVGSAARAFEQYLSPHFSSPNAGPLIFREFPFNHLSQAHADQHREAVESFMASVTL